MTAPDGEPGAGEPPAGETAPADATRVSDRPPAETRPAETPAFGETRVAQTPPPPAETRVAQTPPPGAPSPPTTNDPIVLDPAPAVDTSHAEPSPIAMLRAQRPEVLVGVAFAGGLVVAMILRRLGG